MTKYTDAELLRLLTDIESDSVERKQSFSDDVSTKAREAVCAFANDLPDNKKAGVLFIGVKDSGEPSYLPITDKLLLDLAAMKTDGNILPQPVLTVEKRVLNGADMAVVTVLPSNMPPVKFKGRIWVRTGPRRAVANEQEERILIEKRRYKNIPFDIYPVPSSNISDLSKLIFENEYLTAAFAPDILEENGRSYQERLASCKMITSPEDTTPTVLGLLTLGKSPQDFLAGARVQFLRIDGTELTDPVIDEENIGGALTNLLRRTEEKMTAHNRVEVDVTSESTHHYMHTYPPVALHQILYNAVFHRTYEHTNAPVRVYWFNDRIEITSPGGPYGNVTASNFGQPGITDYRNPNLGEVLKNLGFIQSFGRGIALARKAMDQNGNPPPEFTANQSAVLCILRKKP